MLYGRTITFFLVNFVATRACLSASGAVPPTGQSVTLAWNAGSSSTVAGYRLYYGGASRAYTNTMDVGNSTTATVSDLVAGATYFFAVTDYDIIGLESAFSDEASYTVPGGATLAASALALGGMLLIGRGHAGNVYDIQTSVDLRSWSRIASVTMEANGTFQFTIPNTANDATRWYRLRQTSPSPRTEPQQRSW
jgi:hypothetical protein